MNRFQLLLLLVPGLALGVPRRSPHRRIPLDGSVAVSFAQDTTFAPDIIALGGTIFQGKTAGGLCFSCHGANAKGTKGIAPNLTDDTWLHGDGSFPFIVSTILTGVPKPKEAAVPMPPKGGALLSPEQVHAVAAYVYTLRMPARA